ncbi:uncharacterized protein LOC106644142 isoform X4 [Copidosoma floridanum]|uniref:uncharacterized protein LOC106644142 isoform X4 n=1 Tax=Copidosoma floridanum TaxID=29053 RepID=UPI000C6F48EC|nr:uncharacterized protein LOC106644142 isoform X4 [Copidosoma floridanum]
MTSLILENADLNRLFPKCRPRLAPGQQRRQHQEETAHGCNGAGGVLEGQLLVIDDDYRDTMIDLERDPTTDRCRKRTNGRKKSSRVSRHQHQQTAETLMGQQANNVTSNSGTDCPAKHVQNHVAAAACSSSSSSASGRSEDPLPGHYGTDQLAQSQLDDDSGTEDSPVYILTSAKGDRSYKLRDSRIIEIAGGREVFSQSRGKVARKSRFLAASNSLGNEDNQSDKLSFKKNNKSPNRQTVWELRSKCGETRKQRMNREVTETVFSSEVHSVRRNPSKSILDYDSPKNNRGRFVNYDSILNSNNAEHGTTGPKSITDLEYGLPKNCIDSLGYQSSNHKTPLVRHVSGPPGMALVNDGEVVVFDDIDDNWQNLRLDLGSTNAPTTTSSAQQHVDELFLQHQQQTRTPPEPLSSSLCSSPSPTTTYHRNTSDFFKMMTPGSECESDFPKPELNHHHHHHHHQQHNKAGATRLIGELPIAQYSGSPRRYGMRENVRLPTLLSSPSSVYATPRPGFPQRVLPTTPTQKEEVEEEEEICGNEIIIDDVSVLELNDDTALTNAVLTTSMALATSTTSPTRVSTPSASSPLGFVSASTLTTMSSATPLVSTTTLIATSNSLSPATRLADVDDDDEDDEEEEDEAKDEEEEEPEVEEREEAAALERRSESPLKPYVLPSDNLSSLESLGGSTFDYLYEFSETRKVLEEFFKCPVPSEEKQLALDDSFTFQDLDYELRRQAGGSAYVGQRLATVPTTEEVLVHESPKKHKPEQSQVEHENNFLDLSADTGSSEDLGETEVGLQVGHSRNFTLSPETTECDSNCGDLDSEMSLMMMDNELLPSSGLLGSLGDLGNNSDSLRIYTSMPVLEDGLSSGHASDTDNNNPTVMLMKRQINEIEKEIIQRTRNDMLGTDSNDNAKDVGLRLQAASPELFITKKDNSYDTTSELQLDGLDPLGTPPPPAPQSRQGVALEQQGGEVEAAIKDIRMALQRTKTLPVKSPSDEPLEPSVSPIWIPSLLDDRRRICTESNSEDSEMRRNADDVDLEAEEAADEEEADTDLETDRLLGQQRTDDQGFYDDKDKEGKKKSRNKEALLNDPAVLIEGVLFRARYLGSTQLACEGQPTKSTRMCQAEEAVSRIKALAPEGESQPSTEVDLFISTEKIMVLNTDLKEIMMDHALRTISYIADIGELVVLMARRRFVPHEMDEAPKNRTPKMICHVFESEEAQFIAQSIGQAFQVAYMEFLKANGIEDHSFVKEMDYQEVLNSQEIFGDELQMFAKKEMQKEVVVPKAKGEILGVVIVESGWGSMLPTVVIANLAPAGAAARCGQLNIGDQIIAINGVSLVGLPLSTCQTYIKNSKNQTVVKLTVVPCAPVVEVKIKRPDTKYQLGFSVQNGVICSLLRGGIAERGGVRVGHRIIEINNQSVVAVPHEKIVNLLATSVGEILMKTMPTSMFRLLTGQESPVYI